MITKYITMSYPRIDRSMKAKRNRWKSILKALLLFTSPLLFNFCERRPLEDDEFARAAMIEVKIDWSKSGIDPDSRDGNGVHRASLRFFPKDGHSPVFDLYLEGNVREGRIQVPVGKYSVIVFNESVDDRSYWDGRITFTDVNSFSNFAANAVPFGAAQRTSQFPFYSPYAGEEFIVEPLHLASWSIEHFEVTEKMILVSHGERLPHYLSEEENGMFNALTNITMRALTRPVNINARVENLISTHIAYAAMQGFANKVYMASARTTYNPSSYLFTFDRRKYDSNGKDGVMNSRFLSFGRTPSSGAYPESYKVAADILFVNGDHYKPERPLLFDVTGQVLSNYDTSIDIDLFINYSLPLVEGGIAVDEWEDNVYTID